MKCNSGWHRTGESAPALHTEAAVGRTSNNHAAEEGNPGYVHSQQEIYAKPGLGAIVEFKNS